MAKKTTNKTKKPAKRSAKVRLSAATMMAVSGFAGYHAVNAIAATATIPIIARLVRAIDLTVNTTLDFGTLAMTADRAGRATLDPGLNRLFIDSDGSLSLAGGKPAAGRLRVKGADFPLAVSIDQSTVKLTNGSQTVMVNNFNLLTAKGGTKFTFTPTQGSFSFTIPVGATLQTRTGQVSGTYVGSNRLFASYQ